MKVFGFGDFSTKPGKGDGDKPKKKPKAKLIGWLVKVECSKCREERIRRNRRFAKPSMN
jgi:hypothetical protein